MANDAQKQVYDNVLKRLIEGQFEKVIPLLFSNLHPRAIQELTIETLLPPRRMDKVYLLTLPTRKVILHLEIEVAPQGRGPTGRRMLVYHALLLEKYNAKDEGIPIFTYVLYPFHSLKGEASVVEAYEEEELLHFRYREILLKSLDAQVFMQAHAVPLYGLLPAMNGTSEALLNEAINDMLHYYREDRHRLRDELLCFTVLLQRAKRLPATELENVLRRIRMFDPLLEEDPWVQGYGKRLKAEGIAEGRVESFRESIVLVVQARFPDLAKLAMERVEHLHDLETLKKVFVAMSAAQDERRAHRYLQTLPFDE